MRESPVQSESGETLTGPTDIANDWQNFYCKLFKAPVDGDGYNDEFKKQITKTVGQIKLNDEEDNHPWTEIPISIKEVSDQCRLLKNNKSPGSDNLTNEHLKYMGTKAMQLTSVIFNTMITIEHIPDCFKQGIIIPIPKGGGKDRSVKAKHRPITLLSVLYKLYEKVLLVRIDSLLKEHEKINKLQGAFYENCSSKDVALLLNEIISYYRERGETLYVGMLDAKKAFDSVWKEGLMFKLFDIGLRGIIWKMITIPTKILNAWSSLMEYSQIRLMLNGVFTRGHHSLCAYIKYLTMICLKN